MAQSITLVPVFTGAIQGQTVQLVDARTLHAFMVVLRDFTTWIKGRICKFGFVEGIDYLLTKSGGQLPSGTKYSHDYHLTLDMAKELAMVENNAKGREARRYFIDCEKRLQTQVKPETVQIAMNGANAIAARVHSAAFEQFMKDGGFEHGRWLLSFSSSREGSQPDIRPIARDAFVMSFAGFTKAVSDPSGMLPTDAELANMASACCKRLAERAAYAASKKAVLA